jgi:hypothetical protein
VVAAGGGLLGAYLLNGGGQGGPAGANSEGPLGSSKLAAIVVEHE